MVTIIIIRDYKYYGISLLFPYNIEGRNMEYCNSFDGCFGQALYTHCISISKPCKNKDEYQYILDIWVSRCEEARESSKYKIIQKIDYRELEKAKTKHVKLLIN